MTPLPPWSYTFLSDLNNCPHKAWRKYVAKDLPREEKTPEQQFGIDAHQQFEHFINSGGKTMLNPEWRGLAEPFVAMGAKAEWKLGVDAAMRGVPFFADRDEHGRKTEPYGRGVLDVVVIQGDTAFLADWKTGKVREDPRELAVQAVLLKAHHPEIKSVTGAYVWLKEGRVGEPHDLSGFERCWRGTVATVDRAKAYNEQGYWPKVENPLCGWCPVKDCENNKTK